MNKVRRILSLLLSGIILVAACTSCGNTKTPSGSSDITSSTADDSNADGSSDAEVSGESSQQTNTDGSSNAMTNSTNKPTSSQKVPSKETSSQKASSTGNSGTKPYVTGSLDITDKTDLMAIYYVLWFNETVGFGEKPIYNITEILADNPLNPDWGPVGSSHYWGKPALGYYRSDDKQVIRKHVQQFVDAGIDIIIMEISNGLSNYPSGKYEAMFGTASQVMMDEMLQMRAEGLKTPHVVFWAGTWNGEFDSNLKDPKPDFTGLDIYNRFYKTDKYKELITIYEGKPLLLVTESKPATLTSKFTIRKMWNSPNPPQDGQWLWAPRTDGQHFPSMYKGKVESMAVTPAQQITYASDTPYVTRNNGVTFQNAWKAIFQYRPKVTIISEWNEWVATRMIVDGKTKFVDQYNRIRSRDIEPMAGGHGDIYYQWMKQYIAAYKAKKPMPTDLLETVEAEKKIAALSNSSTKQQVQAVREFVNAALEERKPADIKNYNKLVELEKKLGIA